MYQVKIVYKQRGIWKDRYYQVFNNKTGEVVKDYIQKRVADAVSKNLNEAKENYQWNYIIQNIKRTIKTIFLNV